MLEPSARLSAYRRSLGAVLPEEVKTNLAPPEEKFFKEYSDAYTAYQQEMGHLNLGERCTLPVARSLNVEVCFSCSTNIFSCIHPLETDCVTP